jgi:hypothetical protein
MTSSVYLEYEVALLLAKYGKSAVLNVLAAKLNLSKEELEAGLENLRHGKRSSSRRRRRTDEDELGAMVRRYPEKAAQLRTLAERFRSRTFLPGLRDVKRFFERHARIVNGSRSRAQAFGPLIQLLGELDSDELEALCRSEPPEAYSALGLITDQILRPHG